MVCQPLGDDIRTERDYLSLQLTLVRFYGLGKGTREDNAHCCPAGLQPQADGGVSPSQPCPSFPKWGRPCLQPTACFCPWETGKNTLLPNPDTLPPKVHGHVDSNEKWHFQTRTETLNKTLNRQAQRGTEKLMPPCSFGWGVRHASHLVCD